MNRLAIFGVFILFSILMEKPTACHGGQTLPHKMSNILHNQDVTVASSISKTDPFKPLHFKKGDIHPDLINIKNFLASLGYLSENSLPPTDQFDERLEASVRRYQRFFNLSATGILDGPTLRYLATPRCGREDIRSTNATHRLWESGQWMLSGSARWRSTWKLTYAFSSRSAVAETPILSKPDIHIAVASAFASWAAVVPLEFREIEDFERENIKIEFAAGEHGDDFPFDGRGGTVAHARAPEEAALHFDADELWTVKVSATGDANAMDIESVAVHEIGHIIGLHHSRIPGAIMYPNLKPRIVRRTLTADDIEGAQFLYGATNSGPSHPPFPPPKKQDSLDWMFLAFLFVLLRIGLTVFVAYLIVKCLACLLAKIKRWIRMLFYRIRAWNVM